MKEDDRLKGQQRRIMNALKETIRPEVAPGRDLALAASMAAGVGGPSYLEAAENVRGMRQQGRAANVQAETNIYNLMKQQKDTGDAEAKAVFDAVEAAGGDTPQTFTQILSDLQSDPENVNARNAKAKAMAAAAARGIVPLSVKEREAKITKAAAEATGEDVGPTGNIINKIARERNIPFSEAAFLYQTGFRTGKELTPEGIELLPGALKTMEEEIVAKELGAQRGAFQANFPRLASSVESKIRDYDYMDQDIDNVLPRVSAATAGFASLTGAIPGTPAGDLARDIDTILANVGFNELQAMRDASPTGGALGQVSEREIAFLQSTIANLQTSQSPEQLRRNLIKLKRRIKEAQASIRKAYLRDIEAYGTEAMKDVPTPEGPTTPTTQPTEEVIDWTEIFK